MGLLAGRQPVAVQFGCLYESLAVRGERHHHRMFAQAASPSLGAGVVFPLPRSTAHFSGSASSASPTALLPAESRTPTGVGRGAGCLFLPLIGISRRSVYGGRRTSRLVEGATGHHRQTPYSEAETRLLSGRDGCPVLLLRTVVCVRFMQSAPAAELGGFLLIRPLEQQIVTSGCWWECVGSCCLGMQSRHRGLLAVVVLGKAEKHRSSRALCALSAAGGEASAFRSPLEIQTESSKIAEVAPDCQRLSVSEDCLLCGEAF